MYNYYRIEIGSVSMDYNNVENKNYFERFKYTWGSDEFFFQSILMQSELKNNCENNCLRYLIWQGGAPIVFKLKDYDNFIWGR